MNSINKVDGMNLHHLSIFRTVCEEGGISRGAERLMISQPAVSKQLRQLEQSLGVQLMDRLPGGVRLTQAGELLLDHARRLFAVENEAEQALAQLRGLHRGRLAVGASMTVGVYLLPELLAKFRCTHPSIELQCEIGNTEHIQQLLLRNVVDVGLTEGLVESPDLEAEVFQTDELFPITKPDHPLQRKKNVTLDMFLREPLIVREIGSGTRAVIERALAQRGVEMRPAFTLANTEAIKRTVTAGIGVAIVSSLAIQTELATGQLAVLNVKNLLVRRPLHRLEVRGKTRSPATSAFLEKLSA
jgi:DNA-binding transcriptional LysR family regulator